MHNYTVSNDFFEIITGTENKLHPVYMEARRNTDDNSKSVKYIKNFIVSIERLASKDKVRDERITSTRGNIKKLSAYDNITSALRFLKKNLPGMSTVNQLDDIFKALDNYQPQYTESYEKNVRLLMLEYECATDILITGLSMVIAENIDVEQNGASIKVKKNKGENSNGITRKNIADLSKQLSDKNHRRYLEEMLKSRNKIKINTSIKESVTFMESNASDTVELIDFILTGAEKLIGHTASIIRTLTKTVFGVVPLIRSCIYLKYKRKADTIISLEEQIGFIEQNIEHLESRTNMDPKEKEEIIKKQKAIVESYKRKALKLRAQLSDGEREAKVAIEKDNPELKNTSPKSSSTSNTSDDDFVLENGMTVEDFFQKALSYQDEQENIQ